MSKAFKTESDGHTQFARVKNYITPGGLRRLIDEHRFLLTRERPAVTQVVAWAASNGDRSENADYQVPASDGCARSIGGFAFSPGE